VRRFKCGLGAAASVLMLLLAVQPAFAAPPAGTPFQGQVYCTTLGCNTQCSQFACDSSGRALTPFYVDGTRDPNCAANFNNPAYVYNSDSNAPIGVYIDNEVDSQGSFANRQALVNCTDQESPQQLILVTEYPAETNGNVQPTVTNGQGDTVGNMLEWYPYCNGHVYYKHKQQYPAPLSSIGPNGYMSQGAFVPPGCRSGATATEQSNLWNVEWGYVNGSTFTYTAGATTIGDLLGTCEDRVC
jgi:hypothetical protein